MHSVPTDFLLSSYRFNLPENQIAAEPLAIRDQSRLMVIDRSTMTWSHQKMHDLPKILQARGRWLAIANNTKVFKARLLGRRDGSGGQVEFFILKSLGDLRFEGLMRATAKIDQGFAFTLKDGVTQGTVVKKISSPDGVIYEASFTADPIVLQLGEVPLPPYIMAKREQVSDAELKQYNTQFAKVEGSVAAPTAGRHFTEDLIQQLKDAGVDWAELTLHVGIGTFKPVKSDDIRNHVMHAEMLSVNQEMSDTWSHVQLDRKAGIRKVLAIGTTTARALEAGCDPNTGQLMVGSRDVNIFLYPCSPHDFRQIDALLTNLHLPESTLLMMVAKFIGDRDFTLAAYEEAIRQKYRFYSYGDAMLIV